MESRTDVSFARALRSRLRMQHLHMVLVVAESGSICAASRKLGLTQPAITKSLHELESLLECELFSRDSHGVTPTAAGREVVALAHRLTGELKSTLELLESLRTGDSGALRVGVLPGSPMGLASRAVARLRRERPNLQISLVVDNSDALWTALQTGEVDLALACRREGAAEGKGLGFCALARMRPAVIARSEHPLAKVPKVCGSTLQRYRWLLPRAADPLRDILKYSFAQEGLPLPPVEVEGADTGIALSLLPQGDSLALMDEECARPALAGGELAKIDTALELAQMPFGAAWSQAAANGAARNFLLMLLRFEAALQEGLFRQTSLAGTPVSARAPAACARPRSG